jgi:hypothetical protein
MKTRTSFYRLAWAAGSFTLFAARLGSLGRPKYDFLIRDMAIEQRIIRIVPALHLELSLRHKSHYARLVGAASPSVVVVWTNLAQKLLAHENP